MFGDILAWSVGPPYSRTQRTPMCRPLPAGGSIDQTELRETPFQRDWSRGIFLIRPFSAWSVAYNLKA